MILHAFFVITKNSPLPHAVSVVDESTIETSPYTQDEFLAHGEKQAIKAINASGDEYTNGGWYRISLPVTARSEIVQDLNDITPSFSAQSVTADPKNVQHPSIEGITVTVGRTPGKIQDDEIINL